MRYFAYGSNMLTARLRERVASARAMGRAELAGWTVRYEKRSVDGSAKCTLHPVEGETALGVLFEIVPSELLELDAVEGEGYAREVVSVIRGRESTDAFTYVAKASWIEGSLRPYDWYVELAVAGAREHGLPTEYIESVLVVEGAADPEPGRAAAARHDLIGGAQS